MSTFTWSPDYGASANIEPVVRSTKFGDGYEQRAKFGLNTTNESWPLNFSNLEVDEATALLFFLEDHEGYVAFDWTPPGEVDAKRWVARTWAKRYEKGNRISINTTFDRVYDP